MRFCYLASVIKPPHVTVFIACLTPVPPPPPAGARGAAVVGGGLADGSAPRSPAPGQGQQRGVHPGAPAGALPEGRQEALRQGGQEVSPAPFRPPSW